MNDFILRIPLKTWESWGTSTERSVMFAIFSYTNNGKGECFAGFRKIAKRAGCSYDTAREVTKRMIEKGVLKENGYRSVRGGKASIYTLRERLPFTNPAKENGTALKENDLGVERERQLGSNPGKQLKETIKETTKQKFNNSMPSGNRPNQPGDAEKVMVEVDGTVVDPDTSEGRRALWAYAEKISRRRGGQ